MNWKTWAGAVFLAGIAVGAALPADAASRCLETRQIKITHMVNPTTMIATNMRNERYRVRFTGACRVGDVYPHNHFVYTDLLVGDCLNARDALPTSDLGPCFIESVTPLPDNG